MLEGLEVSVLMLSEVLRDNKYLRLDDEYFSNNFLRMDILIQSKKYSTLNNISYQITDFGAYSQTNIISFKEEGILFLRNQEVKDNFIDLNNAVFIDIEVYNKLTLHLLEGDVVIPRVGTLGKAALIEKKHLPCSANQNLAIIRTNQINHYYLTTFLNSKYGTNQVFRTSTGNVQQWLNLENIGNLKIPILSSSFQSEIETLVRLAHAKLEESKTLYTQAETLLLESLNLQGLKDLEGLNNAKTNHNVKSFKDSFLTSGRLDAEYYQPKYEILEEKIKSQGYYTIIEVFNLLSNPSPSFYTETGTKIIKTKNVRIPTLEIDNITDCTNEKKILVQKNDLIFASMGVGSLGRVSFIENDIENYATDGTLKIFRTKQEFKNQNLEIPTLLYLTSKAGQELIYKYVIGSTGIISISKENIENLIIPKFSDEISLTLTKKVLESQSLRTESENLLHLAKEAVECAIEKGEGEALAMLNHLNQK